MRVLLRITLFAASTLLVACVDKGVLLDLRASIEEQLAASRDSDVRTCAPRHLAMATAELEWADLMIAQGHTDVASDRLLIARAETNAAAQRTLRGECDVIGDVSSEQVQSPTTRVEEQVDQDGDGVADNVDLCPSRPEDIDQVADEDGCPDPDNDFDGVADASDLCPESLEDQDGFQDEDGCEDPDDDGDGVRDGDDECPRVPGPPTRGGCARVYVGLTWDEDRFRFDPPLVFRRGRLTPGALAQMRQLVSLLGDMPFYQLDIEVRGPDGPASERRVDALERALADLPEDRRPRTRIVPVDADSEPAVILVPRAHQSTSAATVSDEAPEDSNATGVTSR